jgi:hypothetical protein
MIARSEVPHYPSSSFITGHRWEVDADQNEKGSDLLRHDLKCGITFHIEFNFTFAAIVREEIL